MKAAGLFTILAAAAPLCAQVPKEPAQDLSVHHSKVRGLEVRFVDYHWQRDLFEAMAKGSREIPKAQREWVLARISIEPLPLAFEGVPLPPSTYTLSLFPNQDGKGMAIELRRIDVREVYASEVDVMAPPPPGRTMYKAPAQFELQDPLAPRLDIAATEDPGAIALTVKYGDRRLSLKLTR